MDTNAVVCTAVVAAVLAVVATLDGRSNRAPRQNTYTVPSITWQTVQNKPRMDAWFTRYLRCTKATFLRIALRVEDHWEEIHKPLHHNTNFLVQDRVAVTLHYLTHSDGYDSTAALFGISKTRTFEYCRQVYQVLTFSILPDVIHLPRTSEDWEAIRLGFETHGFPNVYGAMDGSLIPIKRFERFEGWYSRKGFTAFNLQAVVDDQLRFMSFSLRSGSQNDKAMYNNSIFGQTIHNMLPPGGCILADAGYKLLKHVMTPFPIQDGMAEDEAHYNWVHSRARMAVERAFGIWKNTFRVFKTELLQDDPNDMALVIQSTMVLHNLFIDYHDMTGAWDESTAADWMHLGGDLVYDDEMNLVDGPAAEKARNILKQYLTNI